MYQYDIRTNDFIGLWNLFDGFIRIIMRHMYTVNIEVDQYMDYCDTKYSYLCLRSIVDYKINIYAADWYCVWRVHK